MRRALWDLALAVISAKWAVDGHSLIFAGFAGWWLAWFVYDLGEWHVGRRSK